MSTLRKISETRTDWDLALPEACYAHNSTVSASTKETPFLLMTGRKHPSLTGVPLASESSPQEAIQRVRSAVIEKLKAISSKNELTTTPYATGDVVLLNNPVIPPGPGEKRMHQKFSKQLLVSRVIAPNLLILSDMPPTSKFYKVNMSRVQMAPDSCQIPDYKRVDLTSKVTQVETPNESPPDIDSDPGDPNTTTLLESNIHTRTLPSQSMPQKRKSSVKGNNNSTSVAPFSEKAISPPTTTSRSGRVIKSKVAFDI